jgi:O-antigen/teichoic acid export membrane protein
MALMGIVMMVANLASYVLQFLACKKTASCVRISTKLISRQAGREIGAYCFSLSIWAFATLLVTGLDTTIVGLFDFKSVAYYAVAATVITFILGLQNALFNVLVPAAAVLEARKDAERLGNLLITSTRYSMFALLVTCLPLIVMAKSIISAWVGSEYVASTAILLQVLLVANIVRLSAVPYAMLLIGTGNQRLVTVSPLVEGLSNLLVSVIAGSMLGAVGVAIGTLIGSLIGVGFNLIYNMPRTRAIAIQRCIYLRDGIARALVCAVPAVTLVPATLILHFQSVFTALLLTIILAFTLVLIWNWGLVSSERQKILSMMHIIPSALCK